MRRVWRARRRAIVVAAASWLVVASGLAAVGLVRGRPASARPMAFARTVAPVHAAAPEPGTVPARTFVSLFPACGCSGHTALVELSTRSGRRLRRLATVPVPNDADISTPAAQDGGRLLMVTTSGPRCALRGNYAECPRLAPHSCVNRLLGYTPGTARVESAGTISGAELVSSAVPSPNGRTVALAMSPCTRENGVSGLYLRSADAEGAAPRLLFGRDNACDGIGTPGWSRAGSEVVLPYYRAHGRPIRGPVGGVRACPIGGSELVVLDVRNGRRPDGPRPSGAGGALASRIRLRRRPDRGCVFAAAGFEGSSLVAVEGCRRGSRPQTVSTTDDDAFLVRFSARGRRLRRWPLKRGLEQAVVSAAPDGSGVLVTQDLPANNGEREADFVWELSGSRLRLIRSYRANDAAEILAVAW